MIPANYFVNNSKATRFQSMETAYKSARSKSRQVNFEKKKNANQVHFLNFCYFFLF